MGYLQLYTYGPMDQGILKGVVSLYCWPPVLLVWNQLYDNWHFLFYLQNRLIQTSQTGGQQYSDTFRFSIPCMDYPPTIRVLTKKGLYSPLGLSDAGQK